MLRPIIAVPARVIHYLINLPDILLKTLLKYIKSFLLNSLDMLDHLPKVINEGALLISFHVRKFYTNIPGEYGINAIKFWLEKYPDVLQILIVES